MNDMKDPGPDSPDRRHFVALGMGAAALATVPSRVFASHTPKNVSSEQQKEMILSKVTTLDGVDIFYKDWARRLASP